MKGKQNLMKRKSIIQTPVETVDLSELKLSELRELYPNIKAVSKKEFLEELKESQDV